MRRRVLTLTAALGIAGVAAVGAGAGAASAAPDAMVRVAHFSPDAPNVDVYVNGTKTLSDVAYPTVSTYLKVPAGQYRFQVRPAGAAASSKAVIDASSRLSSGSAVTVAAVGALATIQGKIYSDDLSAPPAGKGKIRVIHAAPSVPAVDVGVANGPTLFRGATFPSATDYSAVAAGSYPLQVRAAGTRNTLLSATQAVRAGSIYTIAAIGGFGKPVRLLPVVDAAGMSSMPAGGVATGAGGTAPGSSGSAGAGALALGAGALLAVGSGVVVRRRRSGSAAGG